MVPEATETNFFPDRMLDFTSNIINAVSNKRNVTMVGQKMLPQNNTRTFKIFT